MTKYLPRFLCSPPWPPCLTVPPPEREGTKSGADNTKERVAEGAQQWELLLCLLIGFLKTTFCSETPLRYISTTLNFRAFLLSMEQVVSIQFNRSLQWLLLFSVFWVQFLENHFGTSIDFNVYKMGQGFVFSLLEIVFGPQFPFQ